MTDANYKNSHTIWQEQSDGLPEQSLLVERYDNTIRIQQREDSITINYESVDELCKLLKKLKSERK